MCIVLAVSLWAGAAWSRALCWDDSQRRAEHYFQPAGVPRALSPLTFHQDPQGLVLRPPVPVGRWEHGGARQSVLSRAFVCLAQREAELNLGLPAVCRCGTLPSPLPPARILELFLSSASPSPSSSTGTG